MINTDKKFINVNAELIKQTEKAIQILIHLSNGDTKTVWLAKKIIKKNDNRSDRQRYYNPYYSIIHDPVNDNKIINFLMPTWVAEKNNITEVDNDWFYNTQPEENSEKNINFEKVAQFVEKTFENIEKLKIHFNYSSREDYYKKYSDLENLYDRKIPQSKLEEIKFINYNEYSDFIYYVKLMNNAKVVVDNFRNLDESKKSGIDFYKYIHDIYKIYSKIKDLKDKRSNGSFN